MRNARTLIVALTAACLFSTAALPQTRPADDHAAVADATREVIKAMRSLDPQAIQKRYAPAKNPAVAKRIRDEVWLTVQIQTLRQAAEKKFAPEPAPDPAVESDDWNWGVIPLEMFEAAFKREPTIIEVKDDRAQVWIVGGLTLQKQTDGRWLMTVDEEAGHVGLPEDAQMLGQLEQQFRAIRADLDAGKFTSAGEVRDRIFAIFGG